MSRLSHELLMRYYDGELDDAEARELERQLDADAEAVLGGLDQLGDVLRSVSDRRAAPADGIADSVLARIEAEEAKVLAPAPASGPRVHARWSFPAVSAVLAAAAVFVLWLARSPEPAQPVARSVPAAPQTVAALPPPTAPAPAPPVSDDDDAPSAAIESVDFGSHNGAIFLVSAGAEATPVVWLSDEPASADPTESL